MMKNLTLSLLISIALLREVNAFSSPKCADVLLSRNRDAKQQRTVIKQSSGSIPAETATKQSDARKLLIQKAKEIDPNLQAGKSTGSYCDVGWSNRLGTVLTPAAVPGVYAADRPFIWNNIDVGGRMTVIELQSSSSSDNNNNKPDLFIHSPVLLDNALKETLDKIGTVKHVVSPNYEHVKYAKMWGEAYPEANMWACPGMMEREPDVRWTGEIPYSARPPTFPTTTNDDVVVEPIEGMWDWNDVQPLHFDTDVNPFTGRPFFNEVVFYHTGSKSLLTTDIYWNYPKSDGVTNSNLQDEEYKNYDYGVWDLAPEVGKIPFGSSLWKFGMDKIFKPFYMNLMVKSDSKDEFQNIASYISGNTENGWEVETIIPCHGDIVRGSALTKSLLKDHFNL